MYNKNLKAKIIAWYTPEIPLPFGPLEFEGLPGLILEIEKDKTIFIAKKITILNKSINIKKPKGNIVTEKKVKELIFKQTGIDIDKKMKERAFKKF